MTKHCTENKIEPHTIQTRDHKTLHRKHKIEQPEPYYKQGITQYCTENIRLRKHKIEQHEPTTIKRSQNTENIRLSNSNPTTNKGSQNTAQKA